MEKVFPDEVAHLQNEALEAISAWLYGLQLVAEIHDKQIQQAMAGGNPKGVHASYTSLMEYIESGKKFLE